MMCHVEAEYLTRVLELSVPGVLRLLKKKCFQSAPPPPRPLLLPLGSSDVVSPGADSSSSNCGMELMVSARRKLTLAISMPVGRYD